MSYLRVVTLVAAKDLRTELRSREQAVSLLVFALLLLVVFHFAFDVTIPDFAAFGPGMLWVAFIFSGVLALNHAFRIEREQDRIEGILMAPIDRSAFYLGKVLSTIVVMTAVEIVLVPLAAILFNRAFDGRLLLTGLALVLNTIGFAAVGTLFAAITTQTRRSEMLLPLLLFPAAVPIALAAVRTTGGLLAGRPFERFAHWVWMSAAYDLIFLAAAVLLFDFALDE
ncbi:MAG TPA: heme exporter protein CcmB [Candidatus Polarisedimenticolia bacterium]|nr:heme exporter protein CcmB [Candidatus Polarisedimenticolia bacterium]